MNSQFHSSEDLDQALQAYQAYQVPCPQDSTMTPERSINHHFTYYIAQASPDRHGSLVDRGANGGLAGSDVRILSRSSRKCTVTGIDSHELQGLDVVQCAALVETNHVLDYTHPSGNGEPPWSNDSDERSAFDPNFDGFGDYTQRAIQTLSILDDSSSTLTPCPTFMADQLDFRTYQHAVNHETPDYEKFRPYFGWVNVDTVQKTMEQSTQRGVALPNTFPMKKALKV